MESEESPTSQRLRRREKEKKEVGDHFDDPILINIFLVPRPKSSKTKRTPKPQTEFVFKVNELEPGDPIPVQQNKWYKFNAEFPLSQIFSRTGENVEYFAFVAEWPKNKLLNRQTPNNSLVGITKDMVFQPNVENVNYPAFSGNFRTKLKYNRDKRLFLEAWGLADVGAEFYFVDVPNVVKPENRFLLPPIRQLKEKKLYHYRGSIGENYEELKDTLQKVKEHKLTETENNTLNHVNSMGLAWKNPLAINRVYEMLEFQKGDDRLTADPTEGGFVIFRRPIGRNRDKTGRHVHYREWRIDDKAVYHDKPVEHLDFFWMTAELRVPGSKKGFLLHQISESIVVNYREDLISAGCHFRGAGVATLSIVKQFLKDEISFEEAKDLYDSRIEDVTREQDEWENTGAVTMLTNLYENYVLTQ